MADGDTGAGEVRPDDGGDADGESEAMDFARSAVGLDGACRDGLGVYFSVPGTGDETFCVAWVDPVQRDEDDGTERTLTDAEVEKLAHELETEFVEVLADYTLEAMTQENEATREEIAGMLLARSVYVEQHATGRAPEVNREVALELRLAASKVKKEALFLDAVMAWVKFAHGQWQKERPTTPGEYPRATLDGLAAGTGIIYQNPDGSMGEAGSVTWAGYWWSEPYPKLPKPEEGTVSG